MYKKSVQGWLKHLDFMILDVVCLWISFTLAFNMRHGSLDVLANSLYRDMMWSLALMDIVVIFFFDSLKNVLKRGFYQEFVMTVKQTCLITLCSVFYLFTFKEAENYSRLVLGYTAALYLLLSYVLRCLWKNCLRKYFGGAEKRSLLIVTVSDIVDTVIDNIKNKNYGDYFVTGVCILDKKAKGRVIDGVTVVADEDDLVEYVCREWVDEVFINIPESEPYPAELLDKFIEMGVVVHMKLAKSQNLLGKKQFVEHLGTYTVLTTSINSVSRRQIILKRMMDIAGGLAGCIITGILCIFVGPAIYIQSPGPIFFKQTRVGKNGKMFQMYKFRSMYMDAEERKAELMKENRVQDGMMFKLDFDPRIIGSKKLPDGTIKKGVGNFIRDWSLDEFPQFLNVLKGDMSLVGTRPPTVDEWDKYELHHRARLATKPGLTGMWQVSGRSNITDFEEVVKLDKQYISEWTMGLDMGYKTLIVDTDPQCNLTGLCINADKENKLLNFYKENNYNIREALSAVFDNKPEPLMAATCYTFEHNRNLLLLPGHIDFAEYDATYNIAENLAGSMVMFANVPGAIRNLLLLTGNEYNLDYILLDMSPSISATNANILMQSDYFIIPCAPDYFCYMAIESLIRVFPKLIEAGVYQKNLFKDLK